MDYDHNELAITKINERFNALELRLSRLESSLNIDSFTDEEYLEESLSEQLKKTSDGIHIESKIGETGLAWLGNIVLFFGMIFLVQYIQKIGYQIVSSAFGYVSVAGIFILAHFLKKAYPKMASIFNLNAYLLLFYVTLRLHFFTATPIIIDKSLGLLLISLVAAVQLFMSVRRRSALSVGGVFLVLSVIAIVSDTTHIMLPVVVFLVTVSILFLFRFDWIRLFYLSIILAYFINLLWFLNNPFMGNEFKAITVHNFGFIYLFVIAAILSLAALVNKSELLSSRGIVGSVLLNGIGFSILLLFYVLSFFKDDYVMMVGSVSVFCLLYSVILHIKSEWKITAALYALYGFITLSVAVYGYFGFPRVYFLLAIQSLLVVTMAIWFRSKFIVVMNTLLFMSLLVFYLSTTSPSNGINISFSIVALLTARILNWKKYKLTIKTDLLRNAYLLIGFVMVLVTLYHMMPARYITLSWTVAVVFYFGLSLILKNVKYRYLALGTMIAATIYFFIVDLARIELVFRIIALMFLAMISIGLSIYYSKKSKKKTD